MCKFSKQIPPASRRVIVVAGLVILLLCAFTSTASARSLSESRLHHETRFTSAPCLGRYCYGDDPYYFANGACAGNLHEISTTVVDSRGNVLATVYNDYSYLCHANFAQGKLSSYSLNLHFTMVTIIATLYAPLQQQCYPDSCLNQPPYGGSAIAWTNMVDGDHTARATVEVFAGTQEIGANHIDQ